MIVFVLTNHLWLSFAQLVQQMLSIEAAPLVLENCRQSNLIVTHIKVDVSAGRIPGAYVVPLVHAMIGVLRNRFAVLWDPVMDCLAALVDTAGATAWDVLTSYLQEFQEDFLSQQVLKSRKREDSAEDSETLPPGDDLLSYAQGMFLVYVMRNSHFPCLLSSLRVIWTVGSLSIC